MHWLSGGCSNTNEAAIHSRMFSKFSQCGERTVTDWQLYVFHVNGTIIKASGNLAYPHIACTHWKPKRVSTLRIAFSWQFRDCFCWFVRRDASNGARALLGCPCQSRNQLHLSNQLIIFVEHFISELSGFRSLILNSPEGYFFKESILLIGSTFRIPIHKKHNSYQKRISA